MWTAWRWLGVIGALLVARAAGDCAQLKDVVLTSDDCPVECGSFPCVLYPASQTCQNSALGGNCSTDATFTTKKENCSPTYKCPSLVTSKSQWSLVLDENVADASTSSAHAAVTQVRDFKYDSKAMSVAWVGSMTAMTMDASFFDTPSTVTTFAMRSVAFPADAKLSTAVRWESLELSNASLKVVPSGIANMTSLTSLNLSGNGLQDFDVVMRSLKTLDLSGNSLSVIPTAIFRLTSLESLYLEGNQLSSVKLDGSQLLFLRSLDDFKATIQASSCSAGYTSVSTTLGGHETSVCVQGNGSVADILPASSRLAQGHFPMIAIIAGASVFVACGIAFLLFRLYRGSHSVDTSSTQHTFDSDLWNDSTLLKHRIDYDAVTTVRVLAKGAFGEVWLGSYREKHVAIKRLLPERSTDDNEVTAFIAEIKLMVRLEHPRIVDVIGVAWTSVTTLEVVTEYMPKGDLHALLDSRPASELTWASHKSVIAIDVTDALVYLHSLDPIIIHRDLKSKNVLLDNDLRAKLSDFGVSREWAMETMTIGVGTGRWIAPEVLTGGHYTEASDVYSLGVVLTELDTCKVPYIGDVGPKGIALQEVAIVQLVASGNLTPAVSPSCPKRISDLIHRCLIYEPEARPSAAELAYELRKAKQYLTNEANR